jgi:2-keto-4-pentenoate hydratase
VGPDEIRLLAVRQLADYDARTPGQVFSQPVHLKLEQAYAVQSEVVRLREQRGESVIGYKVGCTSGVIQTQLGIGQPIFGRLFATECFQSGVKLSCSSYANLAIEGELAVRLARDLSGTRLSEQEILEAIESVFPVIELHHHVLRSARPSCAELIANNGIHAGIALPERETRRFSLADLEEGLSIRINGKTLASSAILEGGPIRSLRWLAAQQREFGFRLSRGQVVLTGSPARLFPVREGSLIVVEASPLGRSWAEVVL